MKIRIETDDYREYVEIPIVGIRYQLDEDNQPIDIVIYGSEKTIEDICEYARIGFNSKEIDAYPGFFYDDVMLRRCATHECLCARLPKFTIIEADICFYE